MVIVLFSYYILILLFGGFVSVYIARTPMSTLSQTQLLTYTFIASLSVSGMLCSIQYIKRLYKACMTDRVDLSDDKLKRIGNMMYFLLRPLFSFVFVIVMIFAILSGMFIVTGSLDYILNEKFLYLCVILSSFIGFSIGKLLDKFETMSNEKIENVK